ncbi:hypothetical protein GPF34_13615 [Escherichia coli]|nr:hypothetical protein [Escherichia coli]
MKRTMLYLSLLAISCSVSATKYPVLTESSRSSVCGVKAVIKRPVSCVTGWPLINESETLTAPSTCPATAQSNSRRLPVW